MEYLKWNTLIARYYFNRDKAGKDVLLYTTKKEIARLGIASSNFSSEEESWEDYCDTVRRGLKYAGKKSFSENVKIAIDEWIKYSRYIYEQGYDHPFKIDDILVTDPENKITYPFFIAFIPLLIIPLTQNYSGARANAYYPPLSDFLKTNNISAQRETSTTFSQTDLIWSLLEKWTKVYCKTDLGIFTERQIGNPLWRYVGKPFSQCILTPKNIREIPQMFWAANIAPFSFISDQQLERIVIQHGQRASGFSPGVIDIVKTGDHELKKIIIDLVRTEYENWQGDVIEYEEDEEIVKPKSGWSYGTLLSAFTLSPQNETVNHFYHFFSKSDLPADLSLNHQPVVHLVNGFSEKIIQPFDQNIEWTDNSNKWKATPSKNEILLYISGSYFGLPSDTYVETDKISRVSNMYLLCPNNKKDSIASWGKSFAPGNFKLIDYVGIPEGYALCRFQNPIVEHPTYPLLKLESGLKLEIRGGMKIRNREFLPGMLPTVWLSGTKGSECLYLEYVLGGEKVDLVRNPAIPEEFYLPEEVTQGAYFIIKVKSGVMTGDDIPYCIVESSFSPLDIVEENLVKRNCRGEVSDVEQAEFVRGSNAVYHHWARQQTCFHEFIPAAYDQVEFHQFNEPYLLKQGNLLLEYLTLKRNVNYEDFSFVMESLAANSSIWRSKQHQVNPRYIKSHAINYFDYAGFVDYDYSLDRITTNKPQILIIPSTCGVEAVLIGGRTSVFVSELADTCTGLHIIIRIIPQQQQLEQYLLPDTIKLIPSGCTNGSQAWQVLRKLAQEMHIEFHILDRPYAMPQIVQFGLQDFSATIDDYKSFMLANKKSDGKDVPWARKTFDPLTLTFENLTEGGIDQNLSLQQYYLHYRYKYILWLNGSSYEVDRDWGRFLLLAELKQQVICYSVKKKILAIPKQLELPRLIAESITLLSGKTPYFKRIDMNGKSIVSQLYTNVPKLFAENLFKKFNQQVQLNLDI